MDYEQRIVELVKSDEKRMTILRAVKSLALPDWIIAAGFVRNLVWDSLFQKSTHLNDIDVVYFCVSDTSSERDLLLETRLREVEPSFPWSVKNQARMHIKNDDPPYRNTLHAMQFWPEKQTSIGVMLDSEDEVVIRHCFDLSFQFNGDINRNPERSIEMFENRIISKGWLIDWPALQIKH